MLITINGERLDETVRTDSMQAMLDDVAAFVPHGEIIVAVDVDGARISELELPARLERPVADRCQVDLVSASRERVVADALLALAEDLDETSDEQKLAADQLDSGQMAAAFLRIGQFVKSWKTCKDAISQSSALLGRDLTSVIYNDKPVADYLRSLCEKLEAIRAALASEDTVALADVLHFDVPEECATWCGLLRWLAGELLASADSNSPASEIA
ncbi:MAG: hypothetical protein AB7N71_12430 [Phycisphaerae bacterium]